MKLTCLFYALCGAAALAPLADSSRPQREEAAPPAWPQSYEGLALQPVPLSEAEQKFHASFPGAWRGLAMAAVT